MSYTFTTEGHKTLLELQLVRLWSAMEHCIPSCVTANHITTIGQLFHFASFLFYDNGWNYSASLSYFIYIHCDGVDGVVARKRMQQSYFGEWLDHTFDTTTIAVYYLLGTRLGVMPHFYMFYISYILGHIEHYISGKMRYNTSYFGINETQFTVCALLLFNSIPWQISLFINISTIGLFVENVLTGHSNCNNRVYMECLCKLICVSLFAAYTELPDETKIIILCCLNVLAVSARTMSLRLFDYQLFFFAVYSIAYRHPYYFAPILMINCLITCPTII